jgi:hypothetical protein
MAGLVGNPRPLYRPSNIWLWEKTLLYWGQQKITQENLRKKVNGRLAMKCKAPRSTSQLMPLMPMLTNTLREKSLKIPHLVQALTVAFRADKQPMVLSTLPASKSTWKVGRPTKRTLPRITTTEVWKLKETWVEVKDREPAQASHLLDSSRE